MTILYDEYRDARRELRDARRVARDEANAIVRAVRQQDRDMLPVEVVAFESQMAAAARADTALRALPKTAPARPKKDVYTAQGRDSYFLDMIAAVSPTPIPGNPPHAAQARLDAHRAEVEHLRRIGDERAERKAERNGVQFRNGVGEPVQFRDLSQTAGLGLEFDAPTWLLDRWTNVSLAAAPLLGCADVLPLPAKTGFEVLLPRFDAIAPAGPAPALQNTALPADNTATDSLSSFVTMTVSSTPVTYQALEQGNVDRFVADAAAEDIAAQVETLLWTGLGTASAEPTGILNAGIGQVATIGQTTIAISEAVGAALATVGKNRLRPATHIFATPERCETWLAYPDGSGNEPLSRPGLPLFEEPIVGSYATRPVVADGAMPTDIGEYASSDTIVACRPKELLVLLSQPVHRVMMEQYAAALVGVVQSYQYVAAIVRYPSSFCWVSGLTAPA